MPANTPANTVAILERMARKAGVTDERVLRIAGTLGNKILQAIKDSGDFAVEKDRHLDVDVPLRDITEHEKMQIEAFARAVIDGCKSKVRGNISITLSPEQTPEEIIDAFYEDLLHHPPEPRSASAASPVTETKGAARSAQTSTTPDHPPLPAEKEKKPPAQADAAADAALKKMRQAGRGKPVN